MDLDVTRLIGAVTRVVTSEEHEGQRASVVTATRTYDTDISDLWDALTTRERIGRWLTPVDGDLRLGGRYQLKGNASGTITTCDAPHHLAVTWEYGGEVSWVRVRLAADGDGTRLELKHIAVVSDEKAKQYGPGAVGIGWDLSLAGLDNHLAGGAPPTPEEAAAWFASDQGKAFMRDSGDGWRDANIAGGADPGEARAAAERCAAAYGVT